MVVALEAEGPSQDDQLRVAAHISATNNHSRKKVGSLVVVEWRELAQVVAVMVRTVYQGQR